MAEQQEHKGQTRCGTLGETLQRGLGCSHLTSHNPGSTCLALGLILICKSGKTDVRAEGRATYWQERGEWLWARREGKVASLLLYRKKWADRGEGGKALAFIMKIEDWVMIGLAEQGLGPSLHASLPSLLLLLYS